MARPDDYGKWAASDSTNAISGENNVETPSAAYQDYGWQNINEHPTRQQLNWIGRRSYEWNQYLDGEITDASSTLYPGLAALAASSVYDAMLALDPKRIEGFKLTRESQFGNTVGAGAGVLFDSVASNDRILSDTSGMTKYLNSDWTAGDGQGGMANGLSVTNFTWYHTFAISDDGTNVDYGYDTDVTAGNLLADSGYQWYRRIGSVYYYGGGNGTHDYTHYPDTGYWMFGNVIQSHTSDLNLGAIYQDASREWFCPPDIDCEMHYGLDATAVGSPAVVDVIPNNAYFAERSFGVPESDSTDWKYHLGQMFDSMGINADQTAAFKTRCVSVDGTDRGSNTNVKVVGYGYWDNRKHW